MLSLFLAFHTVSISTGELEVRGTTGEYTVRVPAHEMDHIKEPERTVLGAIELDGARLAERRCVKQGKEFVCSGKYVFPSEPSAVRVSVRLADAIVGNHVHVLDARKGALSARAVFTQAQPRSELTFRRAASLRPWFIAAVVAFTTFFVRRWWWVVAAGAAAAMLVRWPMAPEFLEAAVVILAGYCLFEAWYVRAGRYRWAACALLGVTAGMYASALLRAA